MSRTKIKRTIFPNLFLLFAGTFMFILYCGILLFTLYHAVYDTVIQFSTDGYYALGGFIFMLIWAIILYHLLHYQCMGVMKINDKYVKYCGPLLPTVKFKIEDIKYIDIRTFKEGNVVYTEGSIDAYKFILLSSRPLPNKRIDKIRPSRRKKIIKFAVSYKLCEALLSVLPPERSKIIEYQMFLYNKTKMYRKKRK